MMIVVVGMGQADRLVELEILQIGARYDAKQECWTVC